MVNVGEEGKLIVPVVKLATLTIPHSLRVFGQQVS